MSETNPIAAGIARDRALEDARRAEAQTDWTHQERSANAWRWLMEFIAGTPNGEFRKAVLNAWVIAAARPGVRCGLPEELQDYGWEAQAHPPWEAAAQRQAVVRGSKTPEKDLRRVRNRIIRFSAAELEALGEALAVAKVTTGWPRTEIHERLLDRIRSITGIEAEVGP